MVALQGCKSSSDMNTLTKAAKQDNAKLADKKRASDFETIIEKFEKDVKKVPEQASPLKRKEYKHLKVDDVCTNLQAMDDQF